MQFLQLIDSQFVSKNSTELSAHSYPLALSLAANERVICGKRACHLYQTTTSTNTNEHLSCGKRAVPSQSPCVSLAASHPKRQFLPPSYSLLSGMAWVVFHPTMRKKLADDFNNPLSTNATDKRAEITSFWLVFFKAMIHPTTRSMTRAWSVEEIWLSASK